jgi:hypothetical protein
MVFKAIASRVQQALYAFATLFVAHPTPATMDYISPLADLQMHVGQWAVLALIPGQSRDIAKNTIVKSATHYNSGRGKEHEKLLIVLKTPRIGASPGKITYIVTERSPRDGQRDNDGHESEPSSPASSSLDISTSPDDRENDRIFVPGSRAPPLDRYQIDLGAKYATLGTVTLTAPMSVAQLAILLNAVNDHSIHDDLFKHQRHWYAYTVWEVLRTQFRGNVTNSDEQDRMGGYMGINVRREDSVETITEEYRRAWQAFCESDMKTPQEQEEETIRQVILVTYDCVEHSLTIWN